MLNRSGSQKRYDEAHDFVMGLNGLWRDRYRYTIMIMQRGLQVAGVVLHTIQTKDRQTRAYSFCGASLELRGQGAHSTPGKVVIARHVVITDLHNSPIESQCNAHCLSAQLKPGGDASFTGFTPGSQRTDTLSEAADALLADLHSLSSPSGVEAIPKGGNNRGFQPLLDAVASTPDGSHGRFLGTDEFMSLRMRD